MSLGGVALPERKEKGAMTAVMSRSSAAAAWVAFVLVSALVRFFRTSLAILAFLFEMYR